MKNKMTIKKQLQKIINKYRLEKKLSVDMVLGWVATEDEQDAMTANNQYQSRWMKYFSHEPDLDKFNHILEVFTDIWNYFPHKSLNDKSPIDMVEG